MSVSNRGATRATAFYVVFVTRAALAQSPAPSAAGFGQYGQGTEVTVPESPARATSTPENMTSTDPGWALKEQRPVTRFGDAGQFVLIAGSGLGISSASYSASSASAFGVTFEPSVEYFVIRNVSVGAELDVTHSSDRGYDASGSLTQADSTLLGAGLHFGVNVRLGERFSLYPMLAVGFHHLDQKHPPVVSSLRTDPGLDIPQLGEEKRTGPWLNGQVAVLYHPVEHFFVGVGPRVYHDFSRIDGGVHNGTSYTSLGAGFVLGGYFDPSQPSEDVEQPAELGRPPAIRKRFGERGTVVITEESGFSYASRSYSTGSSSSSSPSFSITGAFDWFFTDSQSLGLAAFYANARTLAFTGETLDVEAIGVSGRYGFLVPFYSWFSVYPRMALTYSITDRTLSYFGPGNSENPHVLAASIFVPALIHPASHFFVGVGPSVSEDIVHTTDRGPQNRRTAYGASTIIGGWL